MHLLVNAYWEPLEFELPLLADTQESWRCCVNTYLDPPHDICGWSAAPSLEGVIWVAPRSVVLLFARVGVPKGIA